MTTDSNRATAFDYHDFKRDTLRATSHIGAAVVAPHRIEWLDADQLARLNGKNFVTDERWQYRLLAERTILVEISYGFMMGGPVLGLTVFHRDPESRAWDHERSEASFSIAELIEKFEVLNAGRAAA